MTWNAGASTPNSLRYGEKDSRFFQDLLQGSDSPDILVFGFQELVDLEDKAATASKFAILLVIYYSCNTDCSLERIFKSKTKDPSEQEHMSHQYRDWRAHLIRSLDEYMPKNELYHLLDPSFLVGLFTCIFVKSHLRDRITDLNAGEVKRGLGGRHGNKVGQGALFAMDTDHVDRVQR